MNNPEPILRIRNETVGINLQVSEEKFTEMVTELTDDNHAAALVEAVIMRVFMGLMELPEAQYLLTAPGSEIISAMDAITNALGHALENNPRVMDIIAEVINGIEEG